MMISPESYYETHVKGKTKEEIMSVIKDLKREISRLKYKMEHPDYSDRLIITPGDLMRIHMSREYLDMAKLAYKEAGGIYEPSNAEKKTLKFQENIVHINKISFTIGGFFQGHTTYTIEISDELKAYSYEMRNEVEKSLILKDMDNLPYTVDSFRNELKRICIGEWRSGYDLERFGLLIMDGETWNLEIEYNNDIKPVSKHGVNAYPYNFDEFKRLFNIDENEEV